MAKAGLKNKEEWELEIENLKLGLELLFLDASNFQDSGTSVQLLFNRY